MLPRTPREYGTGSKIPKGKMKPSQTQPRTRAKLEKVTCWPVTTFFPSERLTHCNRPGLARTRVGGLEHAWTVSALSEGLVHEKPRVRGAQATALGNTRMRPQEPLGKSGGGPPPHPSPKLLEADIACGPKGLERSEDARGGLSPNIPRDKCHDALSP